MLVSITLLALSVGVPLYYGRAAIEADIIQYEKLTDNIEQGICDWVVNGCEKKVSKSYHDFQGKKHTVSVLKEYSCYKPNADNPGALCNNQQLNNNTICLVLFGILAIYAAIKLTQEYHKSFRRCSLPPNPASDNDGLLYEWCRKQGYKVPYVWRWDDDVAGEKQSLREYVWDTISSMDKNRYQENIIDRNLLIRDSSEDLSRSKAFN